jgi:hypothetical protein
MTREMDLTWVAFLLLKPRPRLLVENVCRSEKPVDRGPRELPGPCTRPIWGDGMVDGVRFDLCSKCFHEWAAFHGYYRLMAANPAASQIDDVGLERLFVGRAMSGEQCGVRCGCGRMGPAEQIVCPEQMCPHRPADFEE